jgi:hypothetical protein
MKMVRFFLLYPLTLFLILAVACKHPDKLNSNQEEQPSASLNDVVMPDGFSYDTYVQVEMAVQFYDNYDRLLKHQVFEVYNQDDKLIMTAATNEFGRYVGRITLPSVSKNIVVRSSRIGLVNDEWTVAVTGTSMNISIKY